MITIKKQHNIELNEVFIKQYSSVVRYSYNRIIKDGITKQSELEHIVKSKMLNISELDASWIKCAIKKSTELHRDKKLYFGGKKNFFRCKYKKISGLDKSFLLEMRGSTSDNNGNRKSELNIIDNNELIFKPKKGIKQLIKLNLSKNEYKLLSKLELLCKEGKGYFNVKLDKTYVYISFDENKLKEERKSQIKNRILGIDLNPNYIGFSIQDFKNKQTLVYKGIIDFTELNKLSTNKKKFEIFEVVKHIVKQCIHYQVDTVSIEDLNISSMNYSQGKRYNKLLNNDWIRNSLVDNLTKWLNINNIKIIKVNPFYTSFIGQIKNERDYDSVAASIEIGYRGYMNNKGFNIKEYVNNYLSGLVTTRWKEMLPDINTFMDLYTHFKIKKKSKNSYRFLFTSSEKDKWSCFSMNSIKSQVVIYPVVDLI